MIQMTQESIVSNTDDLGTERRFVDLEVGCMIRTAATYV